MSITAGTKLGRYEIRSKIGEGGMGEVYLAQDTKLDRKVALKLLPADVASDRERMRRFVQEAKAAAALNHPNIAHIYEIGETDGVNFIAMEYIDGQTLRQLIHGGQADLGKLLRYLQHAAEGLAKAHAVGVVHRDLKPDNVMVTRDGHAKVLDFGLAKLIETQRTPGTDSSDIATAILQQHSKPGTILGTVGYMSPEQAQGRTDEIDQRSDVFSFGCILFEGVTGQRAFAGKDVIDSLNKIIREPVASISDLNPSAPPDLQRVVRRCLAKDPDERYQTIKEVAIELKEVRRELKGSFGVETTPPALQSEKFRVTPSAVSTITHSLGVEVRRHKLGVILALAALISILVAGYVYLGRSPILSDKDTILLADFVNTTGDANFDGTLKQALAVQLRQTPFLNLFPEEGVHETLRYMGHAEDERITPQIGREICQRRGLKVMLIGTIASLGRSYVITLEAISGQTGEAIASQQVEAESKEQVLRYLGQAALELRRQLGESLSTIQKYNAPIEQATTSSLEALNIYSKGLEQIYSGNSREALPLFNRAVEIDPNFAEAYVWLAWTYANFGDFGRTANFAEKAYALRGRVTELEKLRIDDIYHLWATGDWDRQKEADDLIMRLYPNDWVPHNSLTISYGAMGQREKAVAEAREGIRLNPNEVHLYWHLSSALIGLNRFDEAREAIRQGQAHKLDHTAFRNNLYRIAVVQGDGAVMQQQLDLILKNDGEREALLWQARTAAFAGRWREAQAFYRHLVELSGQRNLAEATQRQALVGFCEPEGEAASQALTLSQIVSPARAPFVPIQTDGSLCGEISEAPKLADELANRYPKAFRVNGISVPVTRAAIELRRNQPERAIEFLKTTIPYEAGSLFWPNYIRGQAYLRLGRGSDAAAEFQKILDHRGWDPLSPFYPLAHLGLARALRIAGDVNGSRKAYQDFFAIWKDADADLPILVDAKKEYEKLK